MRIGEAFYKVAMGEKIPAAEAERLKNVLNGLESLLALQHRLDMQTGMVRQLDAGKVHMGDDGLWISTAAGQMSLQLNEEGMNLWFGAAAGQTERIKFYRAGASATQGQVFAWEVSTNNYGMGVQSGFVSTGAAPVSARVSLQSNSYSSLTDPQMEYAGVDIISHGANTTSPIFRVYTSTNTGSSAGIIMAKKPKNIALNGSGVFGGGAGMLYIHNSSAAPGTNPDSGGLLYVSNGALMYRGSGGNTTTIAAAA